MKKKIIFSIFVIWLFWMLPIAFVDAITISDARLTSITDESALIEWKTDERADSAVEYGKENLTETEYNDDKVKNHRILITGLEKDTDYIYQIKSSNQDTAVDNNSGVYYQIRTSDEDQAPLIFAEIPEYTIERTVDIKGRTEINSEVTVIVNGVAEYKQKFIDGNIEFRNVQLKPDSENNIVIRAEDANGNTNEKQYKIICDLTSPVLEIRDINEYNSRSQVMIEGSVSEISLIDIIVNNNPIFSENRTSFSKKAVLEEGKNKIKIVATDRAGNIDIFEKQVYLDTEEPVIEDIKPEPGAFYYEGRAKDDISGITEPEAKVILYYEVEKLIGDEIGNVEKLKIAETTADQEGNFRFNNVNFEKPKSGITLTQISPSQAGLQSREKQESLRITMYVEAVDRAGLSTEEKIDYIIGTCWSGEIMFDVNLLPEYQRPALLSPERLKEGTEVISFVLNLSYLGEQQQGDWQIYDIDVDLACGRSAGSLAEHYENDPRYEISCRILPNRPTVKEHNSEKTLWYVEYKRLRTEKFQNFSKDFWKQFTNSEIIFPLKITIKYKEREFDRDKNKEVWSSLKYQSKCVSSAYFVDVPIDPRKVLPDFLLEDGIEFANKTIDDLNKIIPKLENVIDIVGISCIASMVSRLAVKIYRKFTCEWESKFISAGKEKTCPESKERKQLSHEQLKEDCSSCATAWKYEQNVYQAYRWTCDRIFCHKAPAAWTQNANPADILKAEIKSRACAGEDVAGVTPLVKKENCYKEYEELLKQEYVKNRIDICWQYGNDLYVYDGERTGEIYILNKATVAKGALVKTPRQLEVIKQGDTDNFATAIDMSCKELCERFGKEYTGECINQDKCVSKLEQGGKYEGFLAGYSQEKCWTKQNAIEDEEQCCCYIKEKEEEEKERIGLPEEWNYRDQQLYRENNGKAGKKFPDNRYIPERDRPACFGQNHLFDYAGQKTSPMVDPFNQHISAFQCLCLTGIRARLILIKNIMTGFASCFNQIKETGEADAGVCKEMFSMYVCDLLYQIFVWFKEGCIPLPFGGEIDFNGKKVGVEGEVTSGGLADGFKIGLSSIWDSVSSAGKDLEAEYGESKLTDYLEGGEKAIARKICLAAFGFDVGLDMDAILDMTYTVQFKTSISPFGARRTFLTYNPDTGIASYEYRTSWAIYGGCEIQDYSIDLVCVNLEERGEEGVDCSAVNDPQTSNNQAYPGCNCLYSEEPYGARSKPFFRSRGGIEANAFIDNDEHKVIEDRMRFDHLRFKLNLKKGYDEEKCFPEGHEDGIFYFPIEDKTAQDLIDCFVDQRGIFRCTRGIEWEQRGEAYFEEFTPTECQADNTCQMLCYDNTDNKYKECQQVMYEKGEEIKAKVKITGEKKQCIYYDAVNEKGESITQYHYIPVLEGQGVEQDYYGVAKEIRFGRIDSANFGKGQIGFSIIENKEYCDYERLNNEDEAVKKQGVITVHFDKTGTDEYRIDTPATVVFKEEEINKNDKFEKDKIKEMIFYINGFAIKFNDFNINKECKFQTSRTSVEQKWRLSAELRYPDADNQCDTNAINKIGVIGEINEVNQIVDVVQKRPEKPIIKLKIVQYGDKTKKVKTEKEFSLECQTKNIPEANKIMIELYKKDTTGQLNIVAKLNQTAPFTEKFKGKIGNFTLIKGNYIFVATTVVNEEEYKDSVHFSVEAMRDENEEEFDLRTEVFE